MKGISFYGHDFFVIKEDHELIAESIKRLFMTNHDERLKNPYFGVNLRNMLFELADEETESVVRGQISEQISLYEPRVDIVDLKVENKPNENLLSVSIGFKLKSETPDDARFLEFDVYTEN